MVIVGVVYLLKLLVSGVATTAKGIKGFVESFLLRFLFLLIIITLVLHHLRKGKVKKLFIVIA